MPNTEIPRELTPKNDNPEQMTPEQALIKAQLTMARDLTAMSSDLFVISTNMEKLTLIASKLAKSKGIITEAELKAVDDAAQEG